MANYELGQRSRNVSLVYRCSVCNNPVQINTMIVGVVQVSSSAFNDTTVDDAGAYVMDQLEDTINNCYKNKKLLEKKVVDQEELKDNLRLVSIAPRSVLDCEIDAFFARGTAWIYMDHSTCCPICGKREVWMLRNADPKDMEQLNEYNFPKVYHSDALAKLFIKLKLQEKHALVQSIRSIPGTVEKAQHDYQQKSIRKQQIETRLAQGLNLQQLYAITEEMNALNAQMNQLKAFDMKAKKSIKQQIDIKQQEIDELKSKWQQEENLLKQELHQIELAMWELTYLTNGTNSTAEVVWAQCASAYRLMANT